MSRLLIVTLALIIAGCGGDGENQKFWQEVLIQVLELIVVIATPILLLLAKKAIQVIEKKLDVDIDEKHEAQIDALVIKGIAFAREQSRKALKEGRPALPGSERKRLALDFVTRSMYQSKLPQRGAAAIEELIEAKLNLSRTPDDQAAPKK